MKPVSCKGITTKELKKQNCDINQMNLCTLGQRWRLAILLSLLNSELMKYKESTNVIECEP